MIKQYKETLDLHHNQLHFLVLNELKARIEVATDTLESLEDNESNYTLRFHYGHTLKDLLLLRENIEKYFNDYREREGEILDRELERELEMSLELENDKEEK